MLAGRADLPALNPFGGMGIHVIFAPVFSNPWKPEFTE
jgi:hypothetical protein